MADHPFDGSFERVAFILTANIYETLNLIELELMGMDAKALDVRVEIAIV
ncbi:MAG: hypothetical protein AB1589_00320 [Cyanobacteriota bacterium]